MKLVALTLPATSNASVGLGVLTPTRLVDGWTVKGDTVWESNIGGTLNNVAPTTNARTGARFLLILALHSLPT